MWQEAKSASDVLSSHVASLAQLLSELDLQAVEGAAQTLDDACRRGNTVYTVGNGGSAATASHIAADLSWGRRLGDARRPRAISLAANGAIVTALANDVGYAHVFEEQLISLFREGDVVVAISASGNSENVVRAAQFANYHGGSSVGMVGFDGGRLKDIARVSIHVPTPAGAYELVEDVHHAICHMLASYLKYQAAHRP